MYSLSCRLFLVILLLALISCVPQGDKSITSSSASLIQSPDLSGDFGSFNQLQQADKIFTFSKEQEEEISEEAIVSLDKGSNGSGFEVISKSGCDKALVKAERCFVRVRFSGKIYKNLLVSEVKTAILSVGSVSIPLSATYEPITSGEVEVSGNDAPLSEQMDLECINARCDLILKFKNNSLISQSSTGLSVPSGYVIMYNSCSKVLAPSKSCLVRLRIQDQVGDLSVGEITLNSNGQTISSSVRVIREEDAMSPSASLMVEDSQEIDNEIYFLGSSATLKISLSDDRLNRGVQYSLSSGLTCSSTTWSEMSSDALKTETLTLQSGVDNSFSVKVRDAIGNESPCVPLLVKSLALKNFLISITQPELGKGSISGPSSALGGSSAELSYTPTVGYKRLQWLGDCSTNGNGNCLLSDIRSNKSVSISLACDTGYTNEGNECINVRSCSDATGSGSQSWNGTSWNTCQLSSCVQSGYTVYNNECVKAINLTIASNTSNYSIFAAAGSPVVKAYVTVTVNTGVTVSGTTANPAMITGSGWVSGTGIRLVNNGNIYGAGGNGGNGGSNNTLYNTAGSPGGHALSLSYPITIANNGSIFGGGGGGGGGQFCDSGDSSLACGGSGGGGQGLAIGLTGSIGSCVSGAPYPKGTTGTNGSVSSYGTGGPGATSSNGRGRVSVGSAGGRGGAWGENGEASASASCNVSGSITYREGLAGGAAGKAVIKNGNALTWESGDNTNQVKGLVQ